MNCARWEFVRHLPDARYPKTRDAIASESSLLLANTFEPKFLHVMLISVVEMSMDLNTVQKSLADLEDKYVAPFSIVYDDLIF